MTKFLIVVLLFVALVWSVHAGTLRNRDFQQYHLRVRYPDGRIERIIIPGESTLNGFCSFGCSVLLLETRDRAVVGQNDDVEIFYGRLQVRQPLFPE